jgi:hypothetical protein
LILNSSIHARIRALKATKEIIKPEISIARGAAGVIKTPKERVGESNVYIKC